MSISKVSSLGVLLILSFLSLCSYSQECADVQTGKFYYFGPDSVRFEATRGKHTQTEYSEELGMKYKMKVEWLSECRYKLTRWKIIEGDTWVFKEFGFVICDVVEVTPQEYLVKYRFEGSPEILENFMFYCP